MEVTSFADGGTGDPAAGLFGGGDALAGEGGFIYRSIAAFYHTVYRNRLAGADDDQVAWLKLGGIHFDFLPVPQDGGSGGPKRHQAGNGVGGAGLCPGLQEFAHCNQGEDHTSRFKVQVHRGVMSLGKISVRQRIAQPEHRDDAIQSGRS